VTGDSREHDELMTTGSKSNNRKSGIVIVVEGRHAERGAGVARNRLTPETTAKKGFGSPCLIEALDSAAGCLRLKSSCCLRLARGLSDSLYLASHDLSNVAVVYHSDKAIEHGLMLDAAPCRWYLRGDCDTTGADAAHDVGVGARRG